MDLMIFFKHIIPLTKSKKKNRVGKNSSPPWGFFEGALKTFMGVAKNVVFGQ
jgi:hypothetical protein